MTGSDKHSSLLRYRANDARKWFDSTVSDVAQKSKPVTAIIRKKKNGAK
jgi:hypothetical protein